MQFLSKWLKRFFKSQTTESVFQTPTTIQVDNAFLDPFFSIGIRPLTKKEVNTFLEKFGLSLEGNQLIVKDECCIRFRKTVNNEGQEQIELLLPIAFMQGTTLRLQAEILESLLKGELPEGPLDL